MHIPSVQCTIPLCLLFSRLSHSVPNVSCDSHTQISPADSNEITRITMMIVVVLSFGVATVLDGMLVGVLRSV